MWNWGDMWLVAGFHAKLTFEACSLDFPKKTLGIDLGLHVGNLCPFWILESSTKVGDPNAWKFLNDLSPFIPVNISFGVNPNEFGVLFIMSAA